MNIIGQSLPMYSAVSGMRPGEELSEEITELLEELNRRPDQVVVKVSDGTLLVFPSWLQHSVDPNRSNGERLSISFNIMFSAYTERMSQPLWGDRREG